MIQYTTINHAARLHLGLTQNEYSVAESIYHLSHNPKAKVSGWCNAKKDVLATFLGVSRRSVINIINKLVEADLLERKTASGRLLRTTEKWYEIVVEWKAFEAQNQPEKNNDVSIVSENSTAKSVNFLHTLESEVCKKFTPSVKKVHSKCEDSSHRTDNEKIIEKIDKDSISIFLEKKRTELVEEMEAAEMHLEILCMSDNLKMPYVQKLIFPWARENAGNDFQNFRHKLNSFKRFVRNTKEGKLPQTIGNPRMVSSDILQPGQIRYKS